MFLEKQEKEEEKEENIRYYFGLLVLPDEEASATTCCPNHITFDGQRAQRERHFQNTRKSISHQSTSVQIRKR